jgi:ClpP class serine protease
MSSWNDLLNELDRNKSDEAKANWLRGRQEQAFQRILAKRAERNIIFYASAFLQKPQANSLSLQLTHEEINGFMSVMFGMDWSKGLTLILHTPGGITNAAESVVAYLNSKFEQIEVIVPTFAMSAGTMISLAAEKIIMGRQSQLGPIDPQIPLAGRLVSARAIVDQFERAKKEILEDRDVAHVWAPILQTIGPAMLVEAQNALDYGERMVADWLAKRMFNGDSNAAVKAANAAKYFNDASEHKSHGRRIDRQEARTQGINIEDLEADQDLQDAVLTLYHVVTIAFEKSPSCKMIAGSNGRMWVKNVS